MLKTTLKIALISSLAACSSAESSEWETLFDGSDLNAWKTYNNGAPSSEWSIKDDVLTFKPAENREAWNSNIITKKSYHNFELELEWNVSKGGNSGVFWSVDEIANVGQAYESGPEIQILDNERHSDRQFPTHRAGSLYDMVQALPESAVNPAGQWNAMKLLVDYSNNHGEVWMNNQKVVDFPVKGEQWDMMLGKSKFAEWPYFAKTEEGHIGLQDHGDVVHFRNIRIRNLDKE